jgi:hypothetical protein
MFSPEEPSYTLIPSFRDYPRGKISFSRFASCSHMQKFFIDSRNHIARELILINDWWFQVQKSCAGCFLKLKIHLLPFVPFSYQWTNSLIDFVVENSCSRVAVCFYNYLLDL